MAEIQRIKSQQVGLQLGAELQGLAFRAWGDELTWRSAEEISHQFNQEIGHVVDVNKIYRKHARQGGLLVAYDKDSQRPIGFALAAKDISGSPVERLYKRHFRQDKVYALIGHVCVDPLWQGEGVGRALVAKAMEGFGSEQIPTAYIFEENEIALVGAAKLGFQKSPADQAPKVIEDYFGKDSDAVRQYRFAAPSTVAVIEAARA